MIICISVNVYGQLIIEDGLSQIGQLSVWRNPMYQVFSSNAPQCSSDIFLNLTYPRINQTFYFPMITPNVTYVVAGAVNPVCYTATEGGWTQRSCINGVNWYSETLPRGLPIHLSIWVIDDCGSSKAVSIPLYVYYSFGKMKYTYSGYYVIVFLVLLLTFILYLGYKYGYAN